MIPNENPEYILKLMSPARIRATLPQTGENPDHAVEKPDQNRDNPDHPVSLRNNRWKALPTRRESWPPLPRTVKILTTL